MKEERLRLSAHISKQEARSKIYSLELQKFIERSLRRFVEEKSLGSLGRNEAARVINSLFEELKAAGLEAKIAEIRRMYADEIAQVESVFRGIPQVGEREIFTDIGKATIVAAVNAQAQQVLMQTGATVADVQAALINTAITGSPLDVGGLLGSRMDAMASRIETLANTGLAGFQRTVTLNKAKDLGFELMIYLGPEHDSIIRPFCEDCLDGKAWGVKERTLPIYTMEEIGQMDNEQGLPVATYGGGYNCRHQWRPISAERAAELGYRP